MEFTSKIAKKHAIINDRQSIKSFEYLGDLKDYYKENISLHTDLIVDYLKEKRDNKLLDFRNYLHNLVGEELCDDCLSDGCIGIRETRTEEEYTDEGICKGTWTYGSCTKCSYEWCEPYLDDTDRSDELREE